MEPLTTISENEKINEEIQLPPPRIITPAPYQCLGAPQLPIAPQLQQDTSQFNEKIPACEIPHPTIKQPTAYEIPQPATTN